jgi:hypothetical protein
MNGSKQIARAIISKILPHIFRRNIYPERCGNDLRTIGLASLLKATGKEGDRLQQQIFRMCE